MARKLLRDNNFPDAVIEQIAQKSKTTARRPEHFMKEGAAILKVPFRTEEIQRKVKSLVDKSGLPINVVVEHTPNLKDSLVRSALEPGKCSLTQERDRRREQKRRGRPLSPCISCLSGLPSHLCDRAGLVYLMKCVFCQKQYVGETSRTTRERFEEHHFEARHRKTDKPWGKHMATFHPTNNIRSGDIIFVDTKVLAFETRTARRKIREAIEIRDRKPEINISFGWPLAAVP